MPCNMSDDDHHAQELQRLLESSRESPENVGIRGQRLTFREQFRSSKPLMEETTDDGALFVDGKRRRKARCNVSLSRSRHSTLGPSLPVNDGVTARKVRETSGRYRNAVDCANDDDLAAPADLRKIVERYRIERPESEFPEHTLSKRKTRNFSPTRRKDKAILTPFWHYMQLTPPAEPLQTNYLKADKEVVYSDDESDQPARRDRTDPEAELELRPGIKELEERLCTATITYRTLSVRGSLRGPALRDCGYISPHFNYLMVVPTAGDVECQEIDSQGRVYATLLSELPPGRYGTIIRLGELRFSPTDRDKRGPYRGELTHYRDINGRWRRAKDKTGTPYGPKSVGSVKRVWLPNAPRRRGDGLPYGVRSYDELQMGYAFGATSGEPSQAVEFDNIVERTNVLDFVDSRLSAQSSKVVKMLVLADDPDALAKAKKDIGRAISSGPASTRTMIRRGKKAIAEAAQELAAAFLAAS